MTKLLAAVGVVGVAVGGFALARQDPGLPPPIPPAQVVPVAPAAPPVYAVVSAPTPNVAPVAPPRVVPFEAMTIDQLVDQVEAIRRQKADMERREQEALRALAAKVRSQQERLNKVMGRSRDDGLPRTEAEPTSYPTVPPTVPTGPAGRS